MITAKADILDSKEEVDLDEQKINQLNASAGEESPNPLKDYTKNNKFNLTDGSKAISRGFDPEHLQIHDNPITPLKQSFKGDSVRKH